MGKVNFSDTVETKNSIHKLGTITKSIDVQFVTDRGITTFKVYAGMKKDLSWIKYKNDSITLNHEQGHFDICEIYARKLRQAILKAKSISDAKALYDSISGEEELEQDKYDNENTTKAGGITALWKDSLITRLSNLNVYKNPVIKLPFEK